MKKYCKNIDGRLVIRPRNRIVVFKNGYQIINPSEEVIEEDGWSEYAATPPTEADIAESEAEERASMARGRLIDSDYKVIKCMEAYLCGEPLPYDIIELHKERDAEREIVNNNESK